jgi:hypothetical protein
VPSGEDDHRLGRQRDGGRRPLELALQHGHPAVDSLGDEPLLDESREAEGALRNAQAESLHAQAEPPADWP